MIRIREIDHLVLRVVDLERMLRFYCNVLGCSVESRYGAEGEGPSMYLTDPEGNVVEFKGPPSDT
jgi:glyoxylase I family protein